MTLFVDASALVAITAREPDWSDVADRMNADPLRLCSAMSVWATIAALCRSYGLDVPRARTVVGHFLDAASLEFVSIGVREYEIAADAYASFGKGRHPAALNMGDCFAYACARANDARLLFKGDDFRRTDIEPA